MFDDFHGVNMLMGGHITSNTHVNVTILGEVWVKPKEPENTVDVSKI